jgi:LacI family transcriptional regulator
MIPDVLKGIQAAGLAVPRDVSVISIGDAPWAEVTRPPLTVLTTDERARGRAAAEYLFARLAGDDGSEFLRAWDVQFLVRESCAAPPDLNGSRSVVADAPGQPHGATGFAE